MSLDKSKYICKPRTEELYEKWLTYENKDNWEYFTWNELKVTNDGTSKTSSNYIDQLISYIGDLDNRFPNESQMYASMDESVAATVPTGGLIPETDYHFNQNVAPARISMEDYKRCTETYNVASYIDTDKYTDIKGYRPKADAGITASQIIYLYDTLEHAKKAVEKCEASSTKYYPSQLFEDKYDNTPDTGIIGAVGSYVKSSEKLQNFLSSASKAMSISSIITGAIGIVYGAAEAAVSNIIDVIDGMSPQDSLTHNISNNAVAAAPMLSNWYKDSFSKKNSQTLFYTKLYKNSYKASANDKTKHMCALLSPLPRTNDTTPEYDIYIYRMLYSGSHVYAYGGIRCNYYYVKNPDKTSYRNKKKTNSYFWYKDIKDRLAYQFADEEALKEMPDYGCELIPCTLAGWFPIDNIYTTNENGNKPNIKIYYLSSKRNENNDTTKNSLTTETSSSDFDNEYYTDLYKKSVEASSSGQYLTNHSIIGLPFNFLETTDIRYGDPVTDIYKTSYGSEYTNNILYDMSIAVITPGLPTARTENSTSAYEMYQAIYAGIKEDGTGTTFKNWLISIAKNTFMKNYERFYLFNSTYSLYVQYVNTICHLFATFLGIGDLNCPTAMGLTDAESDQKRYSEYDDTISKMDVSDSFTNQFGTTPAVFIYYNPGTNLSQSFNTTTNTPDGFEKIQSYASTVRGAKITAAMTSQSVSTLLEGVGDLAGALTGNGLLGQAIKFVTQGNNLSLPEIWEDSTTTSSFDVEISLVSPYGDPESVFLYILRPLARLLALMLPRQTGANSYKEPFAIRAFSKGQFNCQIGYIISMSITRGGSGGESHTIHHLPTEITVTLQIQDMYEKVMLSNEYVEGTGLIRKYMVAAFGTMETFGLLFNNIGYLDFIAAYSGYNLNSASYEMQTELLVNMLKNRCNDVVTIDNGKIKFPSWEREIYDSYNDTFAKAQSFLSV